MSPFSHLDALGERSHQQTNIKQAKESPENAKWFHLAENSLPVWLVEIGQLLYLAIFAK